MDLEKLFIFTERLRKEKIGDPIWVPEKHVFEYALPSLEVVVILKIIRAAQSVKSMSLLCDDGLFIDMGAIYRCVNDCSLEVMFLLEEYPERSSNVDKYVKAFFETTIDDYLNTETENIHSKKIHGAVVRSLNQGNLNEAVRCQIQNVYKTFSGYIHSNYAHIMQMYGGKSYDLKFNLEGILSEEEKRKNFQIVEAAYSSVIYAVWGAAQKFQLKALSSEVHQYCQKNKI